MCERTIRCGASRGGAGVTSPPGVASLNGLERLETIRATSSANSSSITRPLRGNPELNQINAQTKASLAKPRLPPQVARLGLQVRASSDDLAIGAGSARPRAVRTRLSERLGWDESWGHAATGQGSQWCPFVGSRPAGLPAMAGSQGSRTRG